MSATRAQACAYVINEFSPKDLAERYHTGMETQVNVRQGKGEQRYDEGRFTPMFTDGVNCWYNYRIASAEDADKRQSYDLLEHFDAVGISGYDPVRGVAVGVGFDFDSIIGHNVGLSNDRLEQLLAALKRLPYVEIRKSTGGAGYHIWVWFDPDNLPPVANRAEHKALARGVLQQMCQETGHDFVADIDCCGAILWICARRATAENGGLTLVRTASEPLRVFPANWREHLDVVRGKRQRTKVHATVSDEEADSIDEAYRDRPRVTLESAHRRFIEQHVEVGFQAIWNQDFGCLNGHTAAIKLIKARFGLKGVFDTVSDGAEPSKPNCFMFPLAGGGWRVYRFGSGTKEASNWEIAPSGWTTCTINEIPTLERAALLFDGVRSPQKTVEAYVFRSIADVRTAVEALGGKIEFPEFVGDRHLSVRRRDEASLIVEVAHSESDDAHVDAAWKIGWVKDRQQWGTVVVVDAEATVIDRSPWADHLARHVSQHGKQVSLFAHTTKGWQQQSTDRVRDFLQYHGIPDFLVPQTLGWCSGHPWELVAVPFAPEYPGGRRWNREGSKLYYSPSTVPGPTPYWDMVLEHIGRGLNDAVETDDWCQAHSIETGAQYLERWIALLIRMPARRLPMLFLYSHPEQNTGKSIFHEGIATLFDGNGFTFADKALALASGFNAELRGRALCVVEETNIAKSDLAYTRLKAWITGPSIQIHPKGKDAYVEQNYTHWVMTANDPEYLPIEPGDTRVVMWEVTPFEGKEIAKDELLGHLRKEAPQFLNRLYQFDITDSAGRHTLPVLLTPEKAVRIKRVEQATQYGGLGEVPQKLCEAIIAMPKPFSGNPTELNRALGDWAGNALKKAEKSRTTAIGRHMKRIGSVLESNGVHLTIDPGRNSTYHISA